jgi:DNA-binding CsgD family transcriptional regulator
MLASRYARGTSDKGDFAMPLDHAQPSVSNQDVMDLVADLQGLKSLADVNCRFQKFSETCELPHVACFKIPAPAELFSDCVYMCSEPKPWIDRYREQSYAQVDPFVQQACRSSGAVFWSDVKAGHPDKALVNRFLDERSNFGMRDGIVVPVHEHHGYIAVVGFSGEAPIQHDIRIALTVASLCYHGKISALKRPHVRACRTLSERELECLRWAAEGKSDWEIGNIINVGDKAVNYHIERAKKKLGVSTRVQAVIHAMRYHGLN